MTNKSIKLAVALKYQKPHAPQVTAIGRAEIWKLHTAAAELGGHLRSGLEDTFYLPDGRAAKSNGELIAALAGMAREVGREIASPDEARVMMRLG